MAERYLDVISAKVRVTKFRPTAGVPIGILVIMADTLTQHQRSERMSRVRGKDTKPEMVVRRLVHGMGFRFRLHRRDLPGVPDLVFVTRKKVIFVHGCFWHRHADSACKLARLPKSRLDFWLPKLEANEQRDRRNEQALKALGWSAMTVWECQIKDLSSLRNRIWSYLR
jgi:DNA mismatch endonuclease (patch repair protein)